MVKSSTFRLSFLNRGLPKDRGSNKTRERCLGARVLDSSLSWELGPVRAMGEALGGVISLAAFPAKKYEGRRAQDSAAVFI